MLSKKFLLMFFSITASLCLSSCGKSTNSQQEIAAFSTQVEDFTNTLKTTDEQINSLSLTDTNTPDELLEILDNLAIEFNNFSELSAPNQYKSIEKLADEANSYMTEAVSYYHDAFEGESFDSQYFDTAYFNYTCAMTRIKYIGYILVGEIPEDENINVQYGNDSKIINNLLSDETNPSEETYSIESSVPTVDFTN